ncbi:glycosyltransferase [Pseudodesulfovibrio sp. JC047]|uniref:glycosyltransferase n=1 Tax=Pseudodesulfovibrio sp. JC047 TaxID=2683199 RepID=UPI001EF33555|nr:glycosyltransferase [Pseudodesulfovibrio sp. JC047]
MKLLHISKFTSPERGGVETFVRDLSVEQARHGSHVHILCHHSKPFQASDTVSREGVNITRATTACTFSFAPLSPTFPLLLRTLTTRNAPNVIHLHLPNPAVLFCGRLPKDIPLVIHWHADVHGSPNSLVKTLYPAYRIFEQRCLHKAASIIATSSHYLESSASLRRWNDKCTVIPLGLDRDRYPLHPKKPSSPAPLIASVGRFAYYKGYEHLVHAAQQLPDVQFVIAGNGPLFPKITQLVHQLGLTDRVHLPGHISDTELHTLLGHATAFCLPSVDRGEAFGVVLLEAMRYGLPLVSTSIPGSATGWVNQDGITGRVVPPNDPKALAHAIQEFVKNPETTKKYGVAAQQRLKDRFTIEKVAESINRVYERVITRSTT